MPTRAEELIRDLGLAPHPEGGFYREIFRSSAAVRPADGRAERAALTAIHYLLAAGARSRWHRLTSDELWVHLEGPPLDLWLWRGGTAEPERTRLGNSDGGAGAAFRLVPAGVWQAAEPTGEFALAGCFVAPGFDFRDESYLTAESEEAGRLHACRPDLLRLL